ncbi:MAG: DUF2892 domain-containing protein [Gammaproteobacteria bacterium]
MTYQLITPNNAENVGSLDRVNRFLVGMTLLTVAVLFTAISETALAGLVAVGFYAGLTAFIGWDPLKAGARPSPQAHLSVFFSPFPQCARPTGPASRREPSRGHLTPRNAAITTYPSCVLNFLGGGAVHTQGRTIRSVVCAP